MKRLMILLIVAVGMMAGIVNAQEMSQDFGVANFAADTSFYSTTVAITHTGTGNTDLGFEASGYTSTNQPPGAFGVYGNQFKIEHFSSFSGRVLPPAADSTWGVNFDDNPRTGYIRFDSVDLIGGSSLSMYIGEFGTNTNDDDVVIRVYVNGDAGFGTDIFDTRPGVNGTLDSSDAVGGATYDGTTLSYDFADTDTSVILYIAILADDAGDGYYFDDVVIGNPNAATLVSPIDWAYVDLELLGWLRPAPINEGDLGIVRVDVLFGTDPNLIAGVRGTVQIETNYDGDSTGNFPGHDLDLDTVYYWRVECIDPNYGNPFVTSTGYTWSFITTVPAEVTVSESEGSTEVSEQDRIINRDDFILTLPKDPVVPVSITVTEAAEYDPLTTTKETMESYDGESANAPQLQVTHSGGTAVSVRINSGADDLEQYLGSGVQNGSASSDLEFFADGADQMIALRFNSVAIPQGATINSALVEFEVDETEATGEVHGIVTGEDVDDAPPLAATAFHIRDRLAANPTVATSSFVWTADYTISTKVPTSDISSVIQEIVDRAGWNSGQSIVLFFTEDMNPDAADIDFIDPTDPWTARSSTYVLDSGNWDTGVTVTIAAIDDSELETDPDQVTLTFATSSADAAWTGLSIDDLIVSVLENECGAWPLSVYDHNLDCVIDLGDLAMFAAEWQVCTMPNDTLGICVDSR